jgi:hypothetical protein
MIILSVIIDLDYIYSSMHRELITHSFIFWGFVVMVVTFFWPHLWIIAPPIFSHLLLDTIDWGVSVFYPFSRKKYGLKIVWSSLNENMKSMGGKAYIIAYVTNPVMTILEIIIMSVSIILLLV